MATDVVQDERVRQVLARLHAADKRQTLRLIVHYLPSVPRLMTGRPLQFAAYDGFYRDKYLALEPEQAAMVYTLAISKRARLMVEYGTSLGVSTIWLADAARQINGRVITTEIVPEKAERARQHLEEAGLAQFVEIRVGDACETLKDLNEPVDLMLNDGFPEKALTVLQLVRPLLSPGALIITDNVGLFPANYSDYLAWVRDPANGFVTTTMPFKSGTEVSVNTRV